jgi:hypothetical protein
MHPGDDGELQEARMSAAPKTLTPDGRFFFDGDRWHAVPLAPEVLKHRRRLSPLLVWLFVVVAAIIGAGILFEALVSVGLLATHQVPG